jgi:hypothetical protein
MYAEINFGFINYMPWYVCMYVCTYVCMCKCGKQNRKIATKALINVTQT